MPGQSRSVTYRSHRLRIGRRSLPNQVYHVVSKTRHRCPFFHDLWLGRRVVQALRREEQAGHVRSLCFVVMPDHLHWLVQLQQDRELSTAVGNVKSYSARAVNTMADRSGPVWMTGFYDRAIRREQDVRTVARYIVGNPLRAGLVRSVGDYPLWDSIWL